MDWQPGDILFSYKGNYDSAGAFTLSEKIKAKCTGLDAAGKAVISVLTGSTSLKPGQRFIRVGSVSNTNRRAGMFFDTITANAPRLTIYSGFSSFSNFSDNYIIDPSLTISQLGKLDSVYDSDFGGYLTGHIGIYTKSLFANISGTSKFYIKEDANNYLLFDAGAFTIAATRFSLRSTNLGIYSGASARILLGHDSVFASAKIGFLNDGSGKLASGNISWDTSGNVTQAGNWTSTATITGATLQTAASGNRVVINSAGLFGYDNTLGTTFSLPTNGDAPIFSKGIINEVEFRIYTSGVIRTSATVGDGSASSAGVLMNNTGVYGFGASQTTSTANVKILASTGELFAKLGTVGGFTIGATSITSTNTGWHSGASAMFLLGHATDYASAKIGLKNDGSGKLASGNLYWDTSGNVTQAGNWTSTATITGATFQTAASGNRVVINSSGLFGYDNTLGTTFSLPTNGDAPIFSKGIINEVEFRIYTSGVIRTSATVGDGSASSAGVLMNNTGVYGFGASQTTSTANVKILASTGELFAKLGTVGGFTIGATSITSTNTGWHSGASAMFLLGHATDYASAKIGLKNDGSGKLASGNISWDTSGNAVITNSSFTLTGSGAYSARTAKIINGYFEAQHTSGFPWAYFWQEGYYLRYNSGSGSVGWTAIESSPGSGSYNTFHINNPLSVNGQVNATGYNVSGSALAHSHLAALTADYACVTDASGKVTAIAGISSTYRVTGTGGTLYDLTFTKGILTGVTAI